ncbi:MAG: hypothetical protein LBT13_02640 [Treponema sp.]|jgi:hypothetical protein|nr:hypothetical protein [Treponema sp.]
MTTDTINEVFETYKDINVGLDIMKRLAGQPVHTLVADTFLAGKGTKELIKRIEHDQDEFDNVMVVSLFAAFERELIDPERA